MKLIILSDIFGKTPEFDELVSLISDGYESVKAIDPYSGRYLDFKDEQEAYDYFQANTGLDGYIDLLSNSLADEKGEEICLVGFSVGASAVWAVSESLSFPVVKCICFYSSQIRNMLQIRPNVDTSIFFLHHMNQLMMLIRLCPNYRLERM